MYLEKRTYLLIYLQVAHFFCVQFKLTCSKNTMKLTNNSLRHDILKTGQMAWYMRALDLEA